jgi:hypothetical protein
MRLRIHDDGRWAMLADPDDGEIPWLAGECEWLSEKDVHEDGWHEAIVLPLDDTGARRLAEAYSPSMPIRTNSYRIEHARTVLERLAEGGERDA